MSVHVSRSISLALILFLIVGLISQIGLPISDQIVGYLEFVLTTDFSTEFLVKPYKQLRLKIESFDFTELIQGLPRIATGW